MDLFDRERLWTARRLSLRVFAKPAPDIISEDVTVPVSRVPEWHGASYRSLTDTNLQVGILAHAGDGNMHPMIPADKSNNEEWGAGHGRI